MGVSRLLKPDDMNRLFKCSFNGMCISLLLRVKILRLQAEGRRLSKEEQAEIREELREG